MKVFIIPILNAHHIRTNFITKENDHAKQYDNDECVMINGMVESCMAIYLGMAMEMP